MLTSALKDSDLTQPLDNMFGDQHIKTVVALVELHKVRNGHYPENLTELRFIGQWDIIHIQSVDYCRSESADSYFVEVQRGWVGKPKLEYDDAYWVGTGYDPTVGPCES